MLYISGYLYRIMPYHVYEARFSGIHLAACRGGRILPARLLKYLKNIYFSEEVWNDEEKHYFFDTGITAQC